MSSANQIGNRQHDCSVKIKKGIFEFFEGSLNGNVDFWGKNEGGEGRKSRKQRIRKSQNSEEAAKGAVMQANVQKYSKTFENRIETFKNYIEIFKNCMEILKNCIETFEKIQRFKKVNWLNG